MKKNIFFFIFTVMEQHSTPMRGTRRKAQPTSLASRKELELAKRVKRVKRCGQGTWITVPKNVKLSFRRRSVLVPEQPCNPQGLPAALGYASDEAMVHAVRRQHLRQYNREVKRCMNVGLSHDHLNPPEPVDPDYCTDFRGDNCNFCQDSDSSSGDDSDRCDDEREPPNVQNKIIDLSVAEAENVLEKEIALAIKSISNMSDVPSKVVVESAFDVINDEMHGHCLHVVDQTPDQGFDDAVKRGGPVRGGGAGDGMSALDVLKVECDRLNMELTLRGKHLEAAKLKVTALSETVESLTEQLQWSQDMEMNPDECLQIRLGLLNGFEHPTFFSRDQGEKKLLWDLGAFPLVGGLGTPTFKIKYKTYFTARIPFAAVGDVVDTHGVRQFFFHDQPDVLTLGDVYGKNIPLSNTGLKKLLIAYNELMELAAQVDQGLIS